MVIADKPRPPERGLVLDGDLRGYYIMVDMQEYAKEYGWPEQVGSLEDEFIDESVHDATDWLNDNVAEDPNAFYWADGSFFYGPPEYGD